MSPMPLPDPTRESYDTLAAAYAEHLASELDQKPLDRHLLNRFAESVRDRGRTADLGCGPGHVARYLREQGVDVLGIDLSPGMIEQARGLHPEIDLRVGDMRSLDLPDGGLAGIVAFYSLIHFENREIGPVLGEILRVLSPGGLALIAFHIGEETIRPAELWGIPISLDFRFFEPAWISSQLREAGFQILEATEREPYEGAEHPSRRCYLLARKRG
jgi:SAM-dependent methyltransferase